MSKPRTIDVVDEHGVYKPLAQVELAGRRGARNHLGGKDEGAETWF
jgi:predicted DNA-binding antitoxin AbrB/MazE fold protein